MENVGKNFEDLDISEDEIKRISDAMKDETFRKLFVEYAEEISNPENRRLYEEELTRLESDRGVDVTFVNPTPGHVLKTIVNGETKGFINICQSDKIDKPKGERQTNGDGKSGLMWHIPHSFAPEREDLDKNGKKCQVYDVVFHPDTYRMAQSNTRFNKIMEDTAIDGIESNFSVKLDRANLKRPNMKFKGTPSATVIRTKKQNPGSSELRSDILKNMPYPYDKMSENKADTKKKTDIVTEKNKKNVQSDVTNSHNPNFTVPKYSILHRAELDMQEYTNSRNSKTSTRPKELVVSIDLPLLKSAASADLDIFEKRLVLESKEPAQYKLDIALPYPVNEDDGSAKFDKTKRCLIVTLPVLPMKQDLYPVKPTEDETLNENLTGEDIINTEDKPLIEVLETSENNSSTSSAAAGLSQSDGTVVEEENKSSQHQSSSSILYNKPEFTFTQDEETINFVINVKNVSLETVSKSFPGSSSIQLKFVSLGSGCFPMHYSLFLQFPDGCDIASDHCSVDVTDSNLVLLILKRKSCRTLWNSFKAGVDGSSLEDKIFLTENNLQSELDRFDQEASEEVNNSFKTEVLVSEMNEKKLTIKLNRLTLKEEDEEYDDTPSSADIEVIHKIAPPRLHSILKQRTISESSDDYGLSPTSESPRSDEDYSKLHKSVSFNNRVDSTSFHSNKCPQSVKTTLHNKRKKARRKENLKQQRKERHRNNSTGSEYSSGDDLSDCHSQSDTATTNSDDFEKIHEETEDVTEEVNKLANAISKGFSESPTMDSDSQQKCNCRQGSDDGNGNGVKTNGAANQHPLDFRTSGKKKRNKGKGKGKKSYQGMNKSDKIASTSSTDDDNINTHSNDLVTNGNSKPPSKSMDNDTESISVDHGSQTDQTVEPASTLTTETANKTEPAISKTNKGSDLKKVAVASGSISQPGDLQRMADETDSSIVRIVAGGSSQPDSDDDADNGLDASTNEHRTKCAFKFSNSVIYDLDVE
ncbi:hypothetical protein SNE40_008997 [Patella caerulea]|uniref:Protein kintoun n=1 Tax=Patella caerulea TaxID=87958 RepID=A0AAN8JSL1_PATCE